MRPEPVKGQLMDFDKLSPQLLARPAGMINIRLPGM
jgi:hypothetical protein